MTDDLVIRPVEPADEKTIARLWQALSDYHVQIDARLPGTTPGAAERYASRLIERRDDPATRTFVAQVNGHVIGYVLGAVVDLHPDLFEHVDVGFIADIYVEPVFRRQGIARRLVETINQWFADQGVEHTELQVSAVNADGQRFWQAVGSRAIMVRMRMDI